MKGFFIRAFGVSLDVVLGNLLVGKDTPLPKVIAMFLMALAMLITSLKPSTFVADIIKEREGK